MFDQYKSLMGKKEQNDIEGSIISRSLNFLLSPYKILFKDSSEKPKKAEVKSKETSVNKTTSPDVTVIKPAKSRAGKILWKKRK